MHKVAVLTSCIGARLLQGRRLVLLDIGYLSALFHCNNLSGDFCGKVLMERKYTIGSVGMFVCKLKRQGGLGVQDGHMNQCLLAKWLLRMLNGTDLWKSIVEAE